VKATLLYSTVHNSLPECTMAKKKATSTAATQADVEKIYRLITEHQLENKEDLESFMQNLEGKDPEEIKQMLGITYTDKDHAQDLVNEALELDEAEARDLICEALMLDPDNADAYIYLAENEVYIEGAQFHYHKAMTVAEKAIGPAGFDIYKGNFWGFAETRPYMRAKAGLANCLYQLGKPKEGIKHYEEMLELNPTDNQGIRYILGGLYLAENMISAYEKLYTKYDEKTTAWLYNHALYLFKKDGDKDPAQLALLDAYRANKWVVKLLVENKPPASLPDYLTPGKKSEAEWYLLSNLQSWENSDGAIKWLVSFARYMEGQPKPSSRSQRQKRIV
jgi:tetratricopeptide (TPR) repeat protein